LNKRNRGSTLFPVFAACFVKNKYGLWFNNGNSRQLLLNSSQLMFKGGKANVPTLGSFQPRLPSL